MKKEELKKTDYYLGLDIGTDSVGYAVSDTSEKYNLLKFNGAPMWGVHLFDAANTSAERRAFRSARRRLDRRQQRVHLLQEIFANEISKVDENFFKRIQASALFADDKDFKYSIFEDASFTDKDYHKKYPTIHHLICDLINDSNPHDIRLVYIACAWLLAHRGHFLSEISEENTSTILDISNVYGELMAYFNDISRISPWDEPELDKLGNVLKSKIGINAKTKNLIDILFDGKKPAKLEVIEGEDYFPFDLLSIVKLLSGGTVKLSDLYGNEDYDDLEKTSVTLGMPDEDFNALISSLGDDGELLLRLKSIYDWATLSDLLRNSRNISEAKINEYTQHQKDLKFLKHIIRVYVPKKYNEVFRNDVKNNYVRYSGNFKSLDQNKIKDYKKCNKEDFSSYILSIVKDLNVSEEDKEKYNDMCSRLAKDVLTFMPKQVNGDNRVIPYQLYYSELKSILLNASTYLIWLNDKDIDGYSNVDKILSIMTFRVPYYVGPLNGFEHGWMVRKSEGAIYPWNFDEKVDLDKSEQMFIARMTNNCSYLPGESVLPKHSLLYEKFEVLNEINNLKINGKRIKSNIKQEIYSELFLKKAKVSVKNIKDFLVSNNYCDKKDVETLSGIDESIKSSLSSRWKFKNLLNNKTLTDNDVEIIIERNTYSESKTQFSKWLRKNYPALSKDDSKYICSLKFKDFGRLSRKLLSGIEGTNKENGELSTIISFMWDYNVNLSELLLSEDNFTFSDVISNEKNKYYKNHSVGLNERLDEMYVSNAVKRPILRSLDVVDDIVKTMGHEPKTIFVEMARGGDNQKKRTLSRKQQIIELYHQIKDEDTKNIQIILNNSGDKLDNILQSDAVYLYFMQLGKCMYSGEPISFESIIKKEKKYDIEHIYPQSLVKDDSVLNNKVLVKTELNAQKGNSYPISGEIRAKMYSYWEKLKRNGLITEEKFKRLIRNTGFTIDEKWGFVNRQLVETRQSTKVITQLLQEKYKNAKIEYVKAGLVSEYRQERDLLKSRIVNDLHHAKDAYLNIVCGNVYYNIFRKDWFYSHENDYSVNFKAIFEHNHIDKNNNCIWDSKESFATVEKNILNNNVHETIYQYCRHGGLFDQNPLKASEGLIPRKKNLPTEKYGGYNRTTASFFSLVSFTNKRSKEIMIIPIELIYATQYMNNDEFAHKYAKEVTEKIVGKEVYEFTILPKFKKLKINTIFSLDGFDVCLCSKDSGGVSVGLKPFNALKLSYDDEKYIKRLEKTREKILKYKNYVINEEFDNISKKKNIELYDLICEKLSNEFFIKRPESPYKKILERKECFSNMDLILQINSLIDMISLFNRIASENKELGLTKACRLSSKLSNWKYKSIIIKNLSPSGIWGRDSINLKELL